MANEIIISEIPTNVVIMSTDIGPLKQVLSRIVLPRPTSSAIYSNFDTYIVEGVRQANTLDTVRTNITSTKRLVVTETTTVSSMKFVRIPPNNWSTLGYKITATLAVVSGTGATIDGGVSSKNYVTSESVYNPSTVGDRANTTTQYDIYAITSSNGTDTTLTAGVYTISLTGTGANMDMATLTGSLFPINSSSKIYPSASATTYFVMEVY